MSKHNSFEPNRRAFLCTVAFGSGAGLLAGSGLGFAAAAEEGGAVLHSPSPQEHTAGYHVTEHIREYYRKAGF